jgi:hypothetical protein
MRKVVVGFAAVFIGLAGCAPDDDLNTIAGQAHDQEGQRWQQMLQAWQESLAVHPGSENAMYNLMVAHYKAGRAADEAGRADLAKTHYSDGLTMCRKLLSVNDTRAEYWQVCGYCKRGIGDTDGAAQDLKRFSELRGSRR